MNSISKHFEEIIISRLSAVTNLAELAKETGLDASTLRKIANGSNKNPTLRVLDQLNNALCQGSDFLSQGSAQSALPEMSASNEPERVAL